MAYPTKPTDAYDYESQASNPALPLPGLELTNDFAKLKSSTDQTIDFIIRSFNASGTLKTWAYPDDTYQGYQAPFTGSVLRSLDNRLSDFVSVCDFGAVPNGTDQGAGTDNIIFLQLAIDHAVATGAALWFPGVFFTSGSLTNLHAVRKLGPGAVSSTDAGGVTRLFYVQPAAHHSNELFIDGTNGSDTNDGLGGRPFKLPQRPFDLLPNYGPILAGTWTIHITAGTYTSGVDHSMASYNPVKLLGPAWFGSVSAPTVVLTGGGTQSSMITCRYYGNLDVENVKATNCEDNVIQYVNGATGTLTRVHSTDAAQTEISGSCLYVANGAKVIVEGKCLFKGAKSPEGCVLTYHATLSMGTNNDVDDAPHVENLGEARCVQASHASLVKLRTCHIDGGTYGVDVNNGSHISHEKGSIDNVTYGYFTNANGVILLAEDVVEIGSGVRAVRFVAGNNGIQDRPIQVDFVQWKQVGLYSGTTLTNDTVAGETADIVSAATALLFRDFNVKGRAIKVVVYGRKTGANGAMTFTLAGSVGGPIRSLVTADTDVGDIQVELTVQCLQTSPGTVDVLTRGLAQFDQQSNQAVLTLTTDGLAVAQNISIAATVAVGDSLAIYAVEAWQAGI